ncbi:MAG: hypothetical protein ACLFPN_01925 [Methanomassiliicoccales archaeon]
MKMAATISRPPNATAGVGISCSRNRAKRNPSRINPGSSTREPRMNRDNV